MCGSIWYNYYVEKINEVQCVVRRAKVFHISKQEMGTNANSQLFVKKCVENLEELLNVEDNIWENVVVVDVEESKEFNL